MIDNEQQKHIHKVLTKILAGWLIVFLVVGGLVIFIPVRGFSLGLLPQMVIPLSEAPTELVRETSKTFLEKYSSILKTLSAVAFKNSIKLLTSRVAQRAAEQMASGITGQKPAFETDFGQFLQEEADGALGDYLNNTIGKMWGKDLCQPLDPLVKVNLQVMAKKLVVGERPSCTFSKIRKNIKDLSELKMDQLVEFSSYFDPNSNDLGTLLAITSGALETQKANEELAKFTKLVEGPYRSLTNPITDEIKTPAAFYGGLALGTIDDSLMPYGIYTGEAVADAIGVFTDTLTSKLLDHYLSKGIYQGGKAKGGGGAYAPAYGTGGTQAAKEQFADLGQIDYNFSGGSMVDVLGELGCGSGAQYECTINDGMRSAIENKMTVRQAVASGQFPGGWVVGFLGSGDSGTQDIKSGIYSYRTLLILRKYRIIPVGWELAAQYYKNYDKSGKSLTLQTLINESKDIDSPYYGLVDENWVLKLPETICDKEGPGEQIEAQTMDMSIDSNNNGEIDPEERREMVVRKTYCADERSCIKESKDGKSCEYYGYCTKDKLIWRIGDGECDGHFSSCQTFTGNDGSTVSYLENTLTGLNGECNDSTDIGCREYCVSEDANGQWQCQLGQDTNPGSNNYMGERIYLNRKASGQECSKDQNGCSNFVRMDAGLQTLSNWIPNSSFDYVEGALADFVVQDNNTDFTTFGGGGQLEEDEGNRVLNTPGLTITVELGKAVGGREFNFSMKHKNSGTEASFDSPGSAASGRTTKLGIVELGNGWYQSNWKYDFLEEKDNIATAITIDIGSDTIDDLQLIEAREFSAYQVYNESNGVSLKKAPASYNCDLYGQVVEGVERDDCDSGGQVWRADIERCVEGGTDLCQSYAFYCDASDVGCRSYEPISYNGVNQPGIIQAADECPKECVGYENYLEQPSFFESAVPGNRNPVGIIPESVKTCNASENGCEEFTNLSEGTEGERREYYTMIRTCIQPDQSGAAIESFYSWASSEEAGNQLRNWSLLRSDRGDYPCTNPVTDANGEVSCQDSGTENHCALGATNTADNPAYNPDCVEFINANNQATWVKFSKVVFASDECVKLRRTYIAAGETTQQIYSAIPRLSQTCSADAVGCREYKGSASNNIGILFDDNFEDGTNQGWTGSNSRISNESIIISEHSLAANGTISKDVSAAVESGKSYKIYFWAKTASGTGSLGVNFSGNLNFESGQRASSVTMNSDWNRYVFSLNNFNRAVAAGETINISGSGQYFIDNIILMETNSDLYLIKDSWQIPETCDQPTKGAEIGCAAYKDEDGKEWYAKSFSKICYDYAVGCEAMIDTQNSLAPYEQEYNTENNDNRDDLTVPADSLIYLVYDEEKICTEAGCRRLGLMTLDQSMAKISFSDKYFLVEPDNFEGLASQLCESKKVGCDEFTPEGKNVSGKVYFKDPGALVCEYKLAGSKYGWYKRGTTELCPGFYSDPANGYCSNEPSRICQSDSDCSGAPCIIERRCIGGRSTEDAHLLDNICGESSTCMNYSTGSDNDGLCSSWVAACPEDSNTCREFQDPRNPDDCDRSLVNYESRYDTTKSRAVLNCDYYYYKTDDLEKCGAVDLNQNCVGFHQTDGTADFLYSSWRCDNDVKIECEADADCVKADGTFGRCGVQPVTR